MGAGLDAGTGCWRYGWLERTGVGWGYGYATLVGGLTPVGWLAAFVLVSFWFRPWSVPWFVAVDRPRGLELRLVALELVSGFLVIVFIYSCVFGF
jgi:hypothetical protein